MTESKLTDLPIGRDTEYALKIWMEKSLVDSLPKIFSGTLYPEILKILAQMISNVYFANAIKQDRDKYLQIYIANLQVLKSYTRALHECKVVERKDQWFAISHRKAAQLFSLYDDLSKLAVTWKNYSRK